MSIFLTLSGHVVALILLVSIVGIGMEVNLFHAIFKWGGSNPSSGGGEGGTVAAVAASISNLSSGGTRRKQARLYCMWKVTPPILFNISVKQS